MIYVHVPFCKSFCIYCGFYSELAGRCGTSYMQAWLDALKCEIDSRKEEIDAHRNGIFPRTLYFGGGTPSVLPDGMLQEIIEYLVVPDLHEVTVEVNPEDIALRGEPYVKGLMAAGVNRFSMGVQAFDDGVLKWMRRRHDAAGAVRAFRTLRQAGAGNISIDLMFGLPCLSDESWKRSLETALELHPEHISAYQLGIDEDSDLYELVESGDFEPMPEEDCLQQYEMLCRYMAEGGYGHYEVSNFALPGFESRHNSAYWDRVPYVGLGPGAHSFRIMPDGSQVRFCNEPVLQRHPRQDPGAQPNVEVLTPEQIRLEELMLGLRKAGGIPSKELHRLCQSSVIEALIYRGLLTETAGRIRIPEHHFFQSDAIIRELV